MSTKRKFEDGEDKRSDTETVQQDDPNENQEGEQKVKKRKSRFDSNAPSSDAATLAAAKAAELTKQLMASEQKNSNTSNISFSSSSTPSALSGTSQVNDIHAQIAAQIASVTSLLQSASKDKQDLERKSTYRTLRLDSMGREIDEKGNLIKSSGPVRTLAIHEAQAHAQKKKEDPYLLHRLVSNREDGDEDTTEEVFDGRLKLSNRDSRAKKALSFVEAGTYIKQENAMRTKEERKVIAGYSSGRKAPEIIDAETHDILKNDVKTVYEVEIPPPMDDMMVPMIEWWDEIFLPKDIRDKRKQSKLSTYEQDDVMSVAIVNSRTFKYIQHPIPVKSLGSEKNEEPLKMFLTKKERKRIRRKTREEREREKRDMQMIGLIKAPEPKFKLSNFMKIIGDQAVADPSKVEQRVMQQVHERQLTHDMRNLAAKLTPAEKRDKMRRKMTEDTSRQVYVALFRVRDLSNGKHKFKVDVNAQQFNLSGVVLLCESVGANLVVVEGGMKGVKKFIRLMLHRISWDKVDEDSENNRNGDMTMHGDNSDNEDETQDVDGAIRTTGGDNRCDLLWQGLVAKRSFHAFRFQVSHLYLR